MNQTLKGALVKFVNENQDNWDVYVLLSSAAPFYLAKHLKLSVGKCFDCGLFENLTTRTCQLRLVTGGGGQICERGSNPLAKLSWL